MSTQYALLNGSRDSLNAIAHAVLQGQVDPVPANPALAYALALGADLWGRAVNVEAEDRQYIDGFWRKCHWNVAMKAVRQASGVTAVGLDQSALMITSAIRVFRGYAYFYSPSGAGNRGAEHSWSIVGNVLLETTGPMIAYFGAELIAQERQHLANGVAGHDFVAGHEGGLGAKP